MMIVMVPYVEREPVERAVVAEGLLLARRREIVALDPARAEGMQADREEERQHEVDQRLRAEHDPDQGVERHAYGHVGRRPTVPQGNLLHAPGPDRQIGRASCRE